MSNILWQGLWISAMGLIILFVAMGLLTLMMVALERLLRNGVPSMPEAAAPPQIPTPQSTEPEDEEIIAAIAAAVAYLRRQEQERSSLGATLESGPGPWWSAGRLPPASLTPTRPPKRKGKQ